MSLANRQELRRESAAPDWHFKARSSLLRTLNGHAIYTSHQSSTAAPVLQIMVGQPGHGVAFPPVPFRLLFTGQRTEPRQILSPGANFEQLKFEFLTFHTA
jgi:hypothetical protein